MPYQYKFYIQLQRSFIVAAIVTLLPAISFSQSRNKSNQTYSDQLYEVVEELCIEISAKYKKENSECKREIGRLLIECSSKKDSAKCVTLRLDQYISELNRGSTSKK